MSTLLSLKHLYSGLGTAGDLFLVAAFVFGWMPSARERAPRLVAVVAVGLRRLRRFNVRARTALVRAPWLRGAARGAACWVCLGRTHGRSARGRRAAASLPGPAGRPAPPLSAGWPLGGACALIGKFLYWDNVSKGGGSVYVANATCKFSSVLQHTRTPPHF